MYLKRDLRVACDCVLLACGAVLAGCSGSGITANHNNLNNNANSNQPVCGNGVVEGNEYCDGTDTNGVTCQDFGFGGGTLGCAALCTFDTSPCEAADWCGDGTRQAPEECDTLDLDGQTCESQGRNGGTLSCQVDCQFDLSQCDGCGDGELEGLEECDDGQANSDTAPDACRTDCRLARCGDGVADTGEACDGAAPGATTCQAAGYDGGTVICDAQCEVSYVGCTTCGNGACEIGEAFQCATDCTLANVSAADSHSCANKVDGTVWCWGYNDFGMLGDGLTHQSCAPPGDPPWDCSLTPVPVSSLTGVVFQRSTSYHSFAILGDGTAWTWGDNYQGQLGTGTVDDWFLTPVQVVGLTGAVTIGTSYNHSCAVKTDGTLWCWGENFYSQLGLGDNSDHYTAQHVTGLQNIVDVAAGSEHTCAVRSDGAAYCWGSGYLGQTGDGLGQGSNTPVQVTGLPPVISVSAAGDHSCALEPNGRVWCWGYDDEGQLGTGQTYTCPNATNNCSLVPVRVDSLSGVARLVSGGDASNCALKWDGTVWCWGSNYSGQLGDGTTTDRPLPVQVVGLTNVAAISLGSGFSCAVDTSNQGWCWGGNFMGELGNNTQIDSLIPVAIQGL